MKNKICLFAGTTEGRTLAEALCESCELTVCVATEYGEVMLDGIPGIHVRTGRMDEGLMEIFFTENDFDRVIDATHPFAEEVTKNIKLAAERASVPLMRILREAGSPESGALYFDSVSDAAKYLAGVPGKVLITTGAKELSEYKGLDPQRLFARVLPLPSSLEACAAAGIPPAHIIAAQGPFSEELNAAQIKQCGAEYIVTKASGKSGGFDEKILAAKRTGAVPVIIGRPPQNEGYTCDEALTELKKELGIGKTRVFIIGAGPGSEKGMTFEAVEALDTCDAVLGARSVAAPFAPGRTAIFEFLPAAVRDALSSHPSIRRAAVMMRGDSGFFSGAKKLISALSDFDVTVIPGVSSVSLFAARLGVPYDGARLMSMHGRDGGFALAASKSRALFALAGGENTADALCRRLCEYGLPDLPVAVGERLSYPDEKITRGTAKELSTLSFDSLCLLYVENKDARPCVRHGIPDDDFTRGDVPMTKSEVRSISLSKLALSQDSVVYDVGAGTGSVSIECALAAFEGRVYAIEKEEDAAALTSENARKFHADNISVICGRAPEALSSLPAPTHAFIGGSSGELRDIIELLLRKNPDVRIVINAVTLETQAEAEACVKAFSFDYSETVSVNIARARKLGRYHMMTAQNPVSVITLQGGRIVD